MKTETIEALAEDRQKAVVVLVERFAAKSRSLPDPVLMATAQRFADHFGDYVAGKITADHLDDVAQGVCEQLLQRAGMEAEPKGQIARLCRDQAGFVSVLADAARAAVVPLNAKTESPRIGKTTDEEKRVPTDG